MLSDNFRIMQLGNTRKWSALSQMKQKTGLWSVWDHSAISDLSIFRNVTWKLVISTFGFLLHLSHQKLETTQRLLLMAIQCYCNLNEINHREKREGYLISNQNTIGTEPLTAVQSVLAFILFVYLIITVANHLVSLNSAKRRKIQ